MSTPSLSALNAGWMASPYEVYTVGRERLRYNGLTWSPIAGDIPELVSLSGSGSLASPEGLELWAITAAGEMVSFDGNSWHEVGRPPGADLLRAVWMNRRDDGWAVGIGAILHCDGIEWTG